MEDFPKELECPISMELLVDPVSVPCCGRTFSRKPLADWLAGSSRCPMCNGDLSNLKIDTLPRNVVIGYMVDEHLKKAALPPPSSSALPPSQIVPNALQSPEWQANLHKITGYGRTVIGCLEITPNQADSSSGAASSSPQAAASSSSQPVRQSSSANFKTLIIPVVDESGSMSGSPTTQVRYSLSRIVDLVFDTPHLLAHVICYSDRASSFSIDKTRPKHDSMAAVNLVGRGGGTSFSAAFSEIIKVCRQYRDDPDITSISILFLTDGEDSSVGKSGRQALVDQLKKDLEVRCLLPTPSMPLTIHSIGFAREHDFDFLNALRLIGSKEGAYRYADPSEDSDSLANKIGSLFKAIAESGSVPIDFISMTNQPTRDIATAQGNAASEFKLVHSDGNRFWFDMTNAIHTVPPDVTFKVRDQEITMIAEIAEDENTDRICNLWYSHLTDQLSGELLQLNQARAGANGAPAQLDLDYKLLIELVLRRANAVLARVKPDHSSYERLLRIIETTKSIQAGQAVDARKLNDMKFEGKYGGSGPRVAAAPSSSSSAAPSIIVAPPVRIIKPNAWPTFDMDKAYRFKVKENDDPIFKAIGDSKSDDLVELIASCSPMIINRDGATPLIAASRVGRVAAVKALLARINSVDDINKQIGRLGPNAADVALLFGYWHTFEILSERGAVPTISADLLFRTCLNQGFYNCANALRKLRLVTVDAEMVNAAPTSEIATWLSKHSSMKVSFATAINQGMEEAVDEKLKAIAAGKPQDESDASFTFSFRNHISILEKPSDSHLRVIELLIRHKMAKPDEIFPAPSSPESPEDVGEDEVTWPLFIAAQNGHIGLLNLILQFDPSKEHLNRQNKKGTTALWISACNRHIDVVYKLVSLGADPNICNLKGDGPLIPCCQKGSLNIVEMLLDSGASMDAFNRNRDNPVLICCRTGQSKILNVLLGRMTPAAREKILTESAEIDGFDPMHAATELDKSDCIRVLHSFGASLESRSADDNAIIASATPLHLAAFYGRAAAASVLIELGADPIATTGISASTPLHLAVKQGHASVVRLLLANDKVKSTMNSALDAENHLAAYYAQSESNAAIYSEFFENRLAQVLRASLYAQDHLPSPGHAAIAAPSSSPAATAPMAPVQAGGLEKRILDLILNHAQSLGAYSFTDFLADSSLAGDSPLLTMALLTGKYEIARGLLSIGAETKRPDSHGVTPEFWAHILGFQQSPPPAYVQIMLDRVNTVSKQSLQNKSLLALPRLGSNQKLLSGADSNFDIVLKMNDGFKSKVRDRVVEELRGYVGKFSSSSEESLMGFTDKLKGNRKLFPEGEDTLDAIIWEAKIHLIQAVATGQKDEMSPVNILALYLYTSHPDIFTQVNMTLSSWQSGSSAGTSGKAVGKGEQQNASLWKQYVQCLYRSLSLLPNHDGEIYRTVTGPFDPREYTIGTELSWNAFSIASRDWNNLTSWTNESPKSDPKSKRGIIFIIQPKTAKCIDKYSRFPVESEVVILPGTRFQVNCLYTASIIAFGQANIRTSTYLAKESDLAKAASGETSIIVELVEISGSKESHPTIEELH